MSRYSIVKSLGARLMALYLSLLLIPIIGIGLYGHFYIQRTLTQNAIQNGLNEVAIRAQNLDARLGHIHDDILYLEQRIAFAQNINTSPTAELIGLAMSHPMYKQIAWLSQDGMLLGGNISETLLAWVQDDTFALISEQAPNTIRFVPIRTEAGQSLLIAGVRLQTGFLLFDINISYLLDDINDHWALLIQPNTLLTHGDDLTEAQLGLEQMTEPGGYVLVEDDLNLYQRTGPGGNWTLIQTLPIANLEANLADYYTTFFVIMLGGVTSIIGLALLAIARIIEPVYQLETMVDQLRQGIVRPPLPQPIPKDEFGKLMTAFDQMAAELEQKRRIERALIEQLIRAQEEERKIIAYDLHDGLIQELVGARFYIGQVRNAFIETDPSGQERENILKSYNILTHAIAEGRRIIQGLHPTVLEDLGLEAALKELCKTMADKASWQMNTDIHTLPTQPDRAASVTLYRITQEALNNAFKHANASHIWLALHTQSNHLCLSVRDNGRGFDPSQTNGDYHWGIRTMRERASMLRGTCEIISKPGTGTSIQIIIPYEQSKRIVPS